MTTFFEQHSKTLAAAEEAVSRRTWWTPYPEQPSGKIYGATAAQDGLSAYMAHLGRPFELPGHPGAMMLAAEVSPFGQVADAIEGAALGISYPTATAESLVEASLKAGAAWAQASPRERVGVCLEILARLNRRSFEMAHAVMHTSGQAFPMAFQAGGPHAQDRALEAVAYAWMAMQRVPADAQWVKPAGKSGNIALEKHWRHIPRGIGLCIGCNTFPTWNTYPGLFASLATGNTVIVKPHPAAILPLALTAAIAREVLMEVGLPADVVLLAPENPGGTLAKTLAQDERIALIDYTGSNTFGQWLRENAATDLVYTEEAGVNSMVLVSTDNFTAMCDNIAFSLSLYSGQMCTAPQNIFIPRTGMDTDEGKKSFDEVARGIAEAVDRLLSEPARAAGVAGTIANPDTLQRVQAARVLGRVVRDSAQVVGLPADARTASPLIVAVDAADEAAWSVERFGPISFVIATDDAKQAVRLASSLASRKGAITAALYDTDESRTNEAIEAFARAGVNLSINLLGGIYVNQSAAFSDFHVTGANPAGNACVSDEAFVVNRFRTVMWRRPVAADGAAS